MTQAYICDRCGRIFEKQGYVHDIWTGSPYVLQLTQYGHAQYHLCDECYEEFEHGFFKNLNEVLGEEER